MPAAPAASNHQWDPRADGAHCDRCILDELREGKPVPSEYNTPGFAVVAEVPGGTEVKHGRPLCGRAGQELMLRFGELGLKRRSASYLHAVACRPPENDFDGLLTKWRNANKKRVANDEEPYLHPLIACEPRLRAAPASFAATCTKRAA